MADGRAWPLELKVSRKARTLTIAFDDGQRSSALGVITRRYSAGRRNVGIRDVRPIGRYAARIDFDDGHDTGLYSWDELYRLGRDRDRLWSDYLRRLAHEGLSRDG